MGDEFSREELIAGEWDSDIDSHPDPEYNFESNGYVCKIIRNLRTWTYCGYVKLPLTHLDFNKKYRELEDIITIHGNLTFGEDGTFGFDCHHILLDDISPLDKTMDSKYDKFKSLSIPLYGREHYWTYDEVKEEVESLTAQFKSREL